MGFARYLRELRKHFLNSRVQLALAWGLQPSGRVNISTPCLGAARARVGFAFVLVSCGNVARTQVAALARVGFAR